MILEHALLTVRESQRVAFETAFAQAMPLIAASPGFRGLNLHHCLERPGRYLLLVHWDSVADHEEGFRRSPNYQEWKALLHHFYDPLPQVLHFSALLSAPAP